MKFTLTAILLILSIAVACARSARRDAPPTWPKSYKVSGFLRLPYAELDEPFQVYYDSASNSSRTDFYGGLVKNYLLGNITTYPKYGAGFKVAYMTTKDVYNKRSCFKTDGTAEATVAPQSILPDLTGFDKLSDSTMVNGQNVSMWYKKEVKGLKTNKYTMYIKLSDSSPVRYEMFGYDSLLGSHYDKYYVDYDHFSSPLNDSGVFDLEKNVTCGDFPGPGVAEHRNQFNPMKEYVDHDDSHHVEMFDSFKKTHQKVYAGDKEHSHRENTFRHNVRFIHSKNRASLSYSLAVNHLADMAKDELKLMNGRRPSSGYNGGKAFNRALYDASATPSELDWRLYGAVNPVKDQAVCGSCWSFGSTGTIEGAYFLATGRRVRFSQQELMDCSWGYGNNACDGGEDFRAYHWIMDNGGLASEADYGAYMGVDSKCKSQAVNHTVQIGDFFNVTSGNLGDLQLALFNHGPISVGIDASHLSLSFYANGVYYEPECRNDPEGLDHAVLAVGYGVMHGQPYWLVKNSWSTYWGNDGYVLMSQKDNNCGVATDATYVSIKL